ncbi:MAG TPA: (Fe-S)-binding protein, partial [Chroococcales cyanobacterium]
MSSNNGQPQSSSASQAAPCEVPAPGVAATLDKSLLDACIHCGLCLPACPTYLATGREMESPRGRIYLLEKLKTGELELDDRLAGHIDSCLGCLGCQTACPSGVRYEDILAGARPVIVTRRSELKRQFMRQVFSRLLPDYPKLRQLARLLKFWQKMDGRKYLKVLAGGQEQSRSGWRSVFFKLWQCESFMPQLKSWTPLPVKSWSSGEKKGTVQLFSGCVMDVFYNHVNHAAVNLLKAQSQVVEVPAQTCCGALAFHAGEVDIAKRLALQNIEYFEQTQGAIAVTSAGCGAMLKYYGELFKDASAPEHERSEAFSLRVKDITELLADGQFQRKSVAGGLSKPNSKKIAYHAACHLAHAQKVREAPARLVEGLVNDWNSQLADRKENPADPLEQPIEAVPLTEAEHCCGSAGIYNILNT